MNSDDFAPATDKYLRADGSVTTLAGELILPADQRRAEEYASRAATADKWLHPDGSVTDSTGRVILEADESRARDYESRAPGTAMYPPTTGSGSGGAAPEDNATPPLLAVYDAPSAAFLYPLIEVTDGYTISLTGALSVTDAGGAVLK